MNINFELSTESIFRKKVLITKCIIKRSRDASGKVPVKTQEVVRICNEKITVFFLDSEKICKHLITVLQCSYATVKRISLKNTT